jgi:hypothetical protein
MAFQTENVILTVSQYDMKGFWLGNKQEHVSKGTALGPDFTTNIYTQSEPGMTAYYNAETGTWTEIKNRSQDKYWSEAGSEFVIGKQDGEYPANAIKEAPPAYDSNTQVIRHKDGAWAVYEIKLGRTYYDSEGKALIVTVYDFDLPAGNTWTAPPQSENGFVMRLVDDEWTAIEDHRKAIIYNTDTQAVKRVESIGEIELGWTLVVPLAHSLWESEQWVQQLGLLQQAKRSDVNAWRIAQESNNDWLVVVEGVSWNAGPASRARMLATLQSNFTPPFWTDANDVDQAVTIEFLQALYTDIIELVFDVHARQREMKAEIAALTTIEDVNSYVVDWSG